MKKTRQTNISVNNPYKMFVIIVSFFLHLYFTR